MWPSLHFPSFPCDAHIPHLSSLVRQSVLCSRPVHTWIKLRSVYFCLQCLQNAYCTYTLQQRIFMYDSYVITSFCREVVRRFQANYPGMRVPSREADRLLVNKFRETSWILDKKRNVKRRVLTEQKLEDIGERLEKIVNVIWVCWNIRDSPGVSAGLACTRYCRPNRTVNSL